MPTPVNGHKLHPSINTQSGLYEFFEPAKWNFEIEGIAHALGNLCRFTGQCDRFYSVAEHSVLVALYLQDVLKIRDKRLLRSAVLHDSAECIIGDINSPLKSLIRHIVKPIENAFLDEVDLRFGLDTRHPRIKDADGVLYLLEREFNMPMLDRAHPEHHYLPIDDEVINAMPWFSKTVTYWEPKHAKHFFLRYWSALQ